MIVPDYTTDTTGLFPRPEFRAVAGRVCAEFSARLVAGPGLTDVPFRTSFRGGRLDGRMAEGMMVGSGGLVTVDTVTQWHTGAGTVFAGIDLYTVLLHEFAHVFGVGTSSQWFGQLVGGYFQGPHSVAAYGGPVPVSPDGLHLRDGITVDGRPIVCDSGVGYGQRVEWSRLDDALLRDMGYTIAVPAPPPPPPPPAPIGPLVHPVDPFPGFRGPIHRAYGELTGDGVIDVICGAGVGGHSHVKVFDGRTGELRFSKITFPGYNGDVIIGAGDLAGRGRNSLVTVVGRHWKAWDVATGECIYSKIH